MAFSGARVYNTSDQALAAADPTTLEFTSEDFDVGGYHDNVTNPSRLTVPANGYYAIMASVGFDTPGDVQVLIFINEGLGSEKIIDITSPGVLVQPGVDTIVAALNAGTMYQLSTGDYVTVKAYNSNGGNAVAAAFGYPTFMIVSLGS